MSICLSSDGNGTATALLDINGKKGPNVYGRDLRELTIKYDKKTKSISTESSTVYSDDTKIPDEDCTGDNYLSLECCKERGDITNNTACCVHSEIADEYPDVCNSGGGGSGGGGGCTSSTDTSEACCLTRGVSGPNDVCCKYDSVKKNTGLCSIFEDIDYTISCALSVDNTSSYEVRCTVSPQKLDTLSVNLDFSIIKTWKTYVQGNGNTNNYTNRFDQNVTITENNRTPSGNAYVIEGGTTFSTEVYDNEKISTALTINDCTISYGGNTMNGDITGSTCKVTLTIEK
jgi:hypothetical protein